jgi:hypothetical protein
MDPVKGVPDTPATESGPPGGFSIKVVSRLVDVGVVAYDKKGHPVTDLKADDFEVYDNGRKQEVRFFSQAPASAAAAPRTPTVQQKRPFVTFSIGYRTLLPSRPFNLRSRRHHPADR